MHRVLRPTTYLGNLSAPWSADRGAVDGVVAHPVPGEVPLGAARRRLLGP